MRGSAPPSIGCTIGGSARMRSRVAWGSEGSDGTAANSTVRALGADSADDLGSGLDITVVAPTYQRADRLERLLRALEAQDDPRDRFEGVVVDGGYHHATPPVDRTSTVSGKRDVERIDSGGTR